MTTLVVCMISVFAWLCVNLVTLLWLMALADEMNRITDRLDAIEGLRGGLDIAPPLEPVSFLRRPTPPKDSA